MSDTPITLAALIRDHQDRTGDSYADIARNAGLSKARIGQLAQTDSPHMPRIETLTRLASALHLPLEVLQSAAMVTAGVSPDTTSADQRIALIVSKLKMLDPIALRHLELFVNALVVEAAKNDA